MSVYYVCMYTYAYMCVRNYPGYNFIGCADKSLTSLSVDRSL